MFSYGGKQLGGGMLTHLAVYEAPNRGTNSAYLTLEVARFRSKLIEARKAGEKNRLEQEKLPPQLIEETIRRHAQR
jgi:hypothetical protein